MMSLRRRIAKLEASQPPGCYRCGQAADEDELSDAELDAEIARLEDISVPPGAPVVLTGRTVDEIHTELAERAGLRWSPEPCPACGRHMDTRLLLEHATDAELDELIELDRSGR